MNNTKGIYTKGIYTAVIIEPRPHKALEFCLTNFLESLDERFNFIIFHGNLNITYLENILNTKLEKYRHRITIINLHIDNLSSNEYSNLLVDESFYNYIPTEYFLIFQTDTMICTKNKHYIFYFINKKYDYVGAPWKTGLVGNGGLSLRKKSKMIEIINKIPYNGCNEDFYFSAIPYKVGFNISLPSVEEAKKFSVETVFSYDTFGVHNPWKYLDSTEMNYLCYNIEGLDTLIKLNS